MMKRFLAAIAAVLTIALLLPTTTLAWNPFQNVCQTSGASQSAICQDQGNGSTNPLVGQNGLFRGISGVIALATGVIAVIVIIVGGIRLTLAGGDPAKVNSARESIVFAIVGLVVIVLADSIISLVIGRL